MNDLEAIKEMEEYEKKRNEYDDVTKNYFEKTLKFNYPIMTECKKCNKNIKIDVNNLYIECDNCGNDQIFYFENMTEFEKYQNYDVIIEEYRELNYENNISKILLEGSYGIMRTGIYFEENERCSTPHNNFIYDVIIYSTKEERDEVYEKIKKIDDYMNIYNKEYHHKWELFF
jgi:hypothetical protein